VGAAEEGSRAYRRNEVARTARWRPGGRSKRQFKIDARDNLISMTF
jgi:hypothetical protein